MPSQLTRPSEVNIFFLKLIKSFNVSFCFAGTAPYYQDVKKRLMATLRQKGPPTCFTTLSSAEFDWDELAQQIYQTNNKKEVTIEFIKYQSQAWRNKLISNNVVQTVVHFAKRTD